MNLIFKFIFNKGNPKTNIQHALDFQFFSKLKNVNLGLASTNKQNYLVSKRGTLWELH